MGFEFGRTFIVTLEDEAPEERVRPVRLAAYLPLTIAILGVAAILVGGVAAGPTTQTAKKQALDMIQTGSIHPANK